MKKLKLGDIVIAVFLGTPEECEVIDITDSKNKVYKLKMKSGTILPGATWEKLLTKPKPWHIVKYVKHEESKVQKDDKIKQSDLDQAIDEQRKFIRGEIKK
tara:strand:+ start:1999 stop:2301 length:303 start_codon:yes stop_codon:yes gene_type:complete